MPALRDRLLVLALVGERPADKGVRLGAGADGEGAPVALDGLVEPARHLGSIAALEVFARLFRPLALGHVGGC